MAACYLSMVYHNLKRVKIDPVTLFSKINQTYSLFTSYD